MDQRRTLPERGPNGRLLITASYLCRPLEHEAGATLRPPKIELDADLRAGAGEMPGAAGPVKDAWYKPPVGAADA